jgi:hypothetical protein
MAARRLVILLVVLLVASSLAASISSRSPERGEQPPSTDTAPSRAREGPTGRLVRRVIDADAPPSRIALAIGDQLALEVRSRTGLQVEIPAFGAIGFAARDAPARFDLLLDRAGEFQIRTPPPGTRSIGTLEVAARGHEGGRRRDGRGDPSGSARG